MSMTNKVVSKRFGIATLLVVLFTMLCMGDVVKLANDSNTPINIFYVPHLFSNIHFVFFYGLSICYLFADIYSVDNSELLEVIRKGKGKLFIQKLGVANIQSTALFFVVVLTVIVMAAGNITWDNGWGKLIHTLCYFNVSEEVQTVKLNITLGAKDNIRDLWEHKDLGASTSFKLEPHSCKAFKISVTR